VQGDQLVIGDIVSTLMACADEPLMEQELRYLESLPTMTQYRLADDQSALTLSNESGDTFLNFVRM
jgi:heat shock protein HslJ